MKKTAIFTALAAITLQFSLFSESELKFKSDSSKEILRTLYLGNKATGEKYLSYHPFATIDDAVVNKLMFIYLYYKNQIIYNHDLNRDGKDPSTSELMLGKFREIDELLSQDFSPIN